jgi:diguanylate cyclase (GGDEF)-like protein/PAS domain S-box-containing protein
MPSPTTRKERVLLVDDEPQVLVALEDALGDDFEVIATDQPERAIRVAENEPELAVVISDQRMPGMTGDELFRRVRLFSTASRVLATGYADLAAVIRAVNEGQIFAYVTKPWQRDDLHFKVQHAADHFRLARELEDERQLLSDLLVSMPDAIFFKDRELRFTHVNESMAKLIGASGADAIVGKRLSELIDPAHAAAMEAAEAELFQDGQARRDLLHLEDSALGRRWMSTTKAAIRSASGQVRGLVGISRDVTERVLTDHALRTSEERLRLAFSASNAGLFDWNLESGAVVYSSSQVGLVGGQTYVRDVASLAERAHPEDRPQLRAALEAHLFEREPFGALELRAPDASGDYRWFELNAQGAWDEQGRPVRLVGSSVDITARKEHAAQLARLEFLASYDDLTRLPNRSLLTTRVERLLGAASDATQKVALAIIDTGRLRAVNESLGRVGGDELVVAIAQRLGEVLRPEDVLARYDGASFAVILSNFEQEAQIAHWFEQSVMPKLGEVFSIRGTDLRMSFKAGIALFPADATNVDALLLNAEAALKKAKRSAPTYLFYTSSMNSKVSERLTLEAKLRKALSAEQFLLFYQPKIQLRTGAMVGVEALIRWKDPERGLVPPGLFIPVLEDTEMILDVGRWVVERAARQYLEWSAQGLVVPRIAVNVSTVQLAQRDFVESLDAVLSAHPGARTGIDLEITESVLMDDLAGNIAKLRAAKERGLAVAIDDFGTGYSSLGYLSRLPLDALKIDRSFIDGMAEDPQRMSIVTTIISLAHSLELKVIAEGVETASQAQLLRLLRCDEIQGYLVARPLPAEEVAQKFGRRFEPPNYQPAEAEPTHRHRE